jgi:predicted  nucleic acid-binding Zn-ribbon protein
LALTLLPSRAAQAQPPFTGPEFQVNVYTSSYQYLADVAIAENGAFVVVWSSYEQDGGLAGVFGRRFNAAGVALGGEFQVNVATVDLDDQPAIAVEPNGDFVVVWRSGEDADTGEIFGRRFDSAGAALGGHFLVNTHTVDLQDTPDVAVDGDGDFLVTWTSENQDDDSIPIPDRNGGVFAQRFDSAGARVGGEFQVNTFTLNRQRNATIAMRADGSFVVVWASRSQDEDPSEITTHDGVFAQRFSSTGGRVGIEFQVNTQTFYYQHEPAIGISAAGDFVIVWHGYTETAYSDLFAQRFDSSGARLGGEFRVNDFTLSYQEETALVMEEDGDFVVVWDSNSADGDEFGVFGKRYDSSGAALGGEFQISTFTVDDQSHPAVTRSVEGAFVVVWRSDGQDGYGDGVFAKRFASVPELDVDANGNVDALTDGVLVLRWAFSFTGTALVNGATGPGCTRCTGAEVDTYLDGLGALLDIDANGPPPAALTDALLVLRYLFGFTGATLIQGAVAPNCTRCLAGEIETHLGGLVT